jgi:tRNA (guanine-N7-)-methyltransferase
MDKPTSIVTPPNWTDPLPLPEIFPSRAPLEVDVGCGKGRFLVTRARRYPAVNFLGIDRLLRRLRIVDRKILRAGLTNVRLLRLEAAYGIKYLLPPSCVSTFYFFFPDPWPKRRHHRRRLFDKAFIETVHATLLPGGSVHVATDHLEYFDEIRAQFVCNDGFAGIPPFEPAEDERTNFELIFRKKGESIGRCSFRRVPTRKPQ